MATKKEEVKVLTPIEFYESVKKTDPKYVKNQNVGGRKISTIDPQYQTENATKAFVGLYGSTWGIKDIEFTTRQYPNATEVMTLKGTFFHPYGEFPYAVSGKSYYVSKGGNHIIDEDIEKKLVTSMKSKCLSILGFNADIFMGLFDNAGYVNEVAQEFALITYEQYQAIAKLLQETGTVATDFNNAFSIDKTMELPLSEYNKAIAMLNAKKSKIAKEAKAQEATDEDK